MNPCLTTVPMNPCWCSSAGYVSINCGGKTNHAVTEILIIEFISRSMICFSSQSIPKSSTQNFNWQEKNNMNTGRESAKRVWVSVANQRYEIQTVKFLKWIYSEISEMLRRHRKGNAVKEVCSKTEQKRLVCLTKYSSRFYPQWVYLM